MVSEAIFNADRTYRYRLERTVGPEAKTALFVMLNPSTADEAKDDPTIRRCISFAKREGCGRLLVCNLYALRATNPKALRKVGNPVGLDNAKHLRQAASEADIIVAAWGGNHLGGEWPKLVLGLLREYAPVHALALTNQGEPGHPLYIRGDARLIVLDALCRACRENDNYRFAYGCTGPCRNAGT